MAGKGLWLPAFSFTEKPTMAKGQDQLSEAAEARGLCPEACGEAQAAVLGVEGASRAFCVESKSPFLLAPPAGPCCSSDCLLLCSQMVHES